MIKKFTDSLKSIIGDKHEVTEAIREALEDRVTSPFYGYFIISWLLVNWNYIYAALFVNAQYVFEKTGLLRNEYLFQEVLPAHLVSTTYWLDFLVIPFIFTCAAFWLMPLLTRVFFRQHIRNKIKNEGIRAEEMAAEIKAEEKILEAEVSKAKVEKEAHQSTPEVLWKNEYKEFKENPLHKIFYNLIEHYYKHNAQIETQQGKIRNDLLVFCDVNKLINIDYNSFELTNKGKEFVKLYIQDSPDWDEIPF